MKGRSTRTGQDRTRKSVRLESKGRTNNKAKARAQEEREEPASDSSFKNGTLKWDGTGTALMMGQGARGNAKRRRRGAAAALRVGGRVKQEASRLTNIYFGLPASALASAGGEGGGGRGRLGQWRGRHAAWATRGSVVTLWPSTMCAVLGTTREGV